MLQPARQVRADLQKFFHDEDVDPTAVELSLLVVDADACEAGACVQRGTGIIVIERGEDHLMVAGRSREIDQAVEQLPPNPFATPASLDVDGEIADVVVRLARIEAVQAGPTDNSAIRVGNDDGVARLTLQKPGAA